MANVAQLIINISANVTQFNRNVNSVNRNVNNMNRNIASGARNSTSALSALGSTFKSAFAVGAVISGLYSLEQAIGSLINSGVEFNKTIQDTEMAFKVMTGGNVEEAKKLTSQMIEMARTSPLSTQEVAKAGVTLNSFGVETENLMGTLYALGDVARGDNDRFQRLALAFGQMTSAGRLMGQETLQFINAGFNPLSQIADVMAKKMGGLARDYMPQLKKAMEDGAISSKMVTQAFMIATSEGGKFNNSMVEMAKTFGGQMNILKDNIMILMAGALKPLMDFMASTLLPIINTVLESLISMFKLFGIEIEKSNQKAEYSMLDMADAMNQSTKEQKKNKKASNGNIQSFDELHQIQKKINETDSAGGAIANLSKMMDEASVGLKQGKNPVEESLKGVRESVQNFFNLFKQPINMSNLTNALNNLEIAVRPFSATIGNGLKTFITEVINPITKIVIEKTLPEFLNLLSQAVLPFANNVGLGLDWFFKNVLSPLSTFIIGDVVPLFLSALNSILKILNKTIEEIKPVALWLFDNLLNPLAKWTGKVAIESLKGFNEQLTIFSNWYTKNGSVLDKLYKQFDSLSSPVKFLSVLIGSFLFTAFGLIITRILLARGAMFLITTATYIFFFTLSNLLKAFQFVIRGLGYLYGVLMAHPYIRVASAIIALITTTMYLYQTNENFRNNMKEVWDFIRYVVDFAVAGIGYWLNLLIIYFTKRVPIALSILKESFVYAFSLLSDKVTGIIDGLVNTIKSGVNIMLSVVRNLVEKINSLKFTVPNIPEIFGSLAGRVIGFDIDISKFKDLDLKESLSRQFFQDMMSSSVKAIESLKKERDAVEREINSIPTIKEFTDQQQVRYKMEGSFEPIDFNSLNTSIQQGIASFTNTVTSMFAGDKNLGTEDNPVTTTLDEGSINSLANAINQAIMLSGNDEKNITQQSMSLNLDGREFARLITPYLQKEEQRVGTSVVVSNA